MCPVEVIQPDFFPMPDAFPVALTTMVVGAVLFFAYPRHHLWLFVMASDIGGVKKYVVLKLFNPRWKTFWKFAIYSRFAELLSQGNLNKPTQVSNKQRMENSLKHKHTHTHLMSYPMASTYQIQSITKH